MFGLLNRHTSNQKIHLADGVEMVEQKVCNILHQHTSDTLDEMKGDIKDIKTMLNPSHQTQGGQPPQT